MSGQAVKMSKIMEHTLNQHADGLYNPLRNALNKSGVPFNYRSYQSSRSSLTPQKVENSFITHDIKMLSAVQAQKIRKNTFIPADKELVPTKHLQKIAGKHFYAVDIEQRVGDPLTTSQFDRSRKNQTSEILYQYKDLHGNSIPFPTYKGQIYESFAQDKVGGGYVANTGKSTQQGTLQRDARERPSSTFIKTPVFQPFAQLQSNLRQQKTNGPLPFSLEPYPSQLQPQSPPPTYEFSDMSMGQNQSYQFPQQKTYLTTQPSYEYNVPYLKAGQSFNQRPIESEITPVHDRNSSLEKPKRPTLVNMKKVESHEIEGNKLKTRNAPRTSRSESQLSQLRSSGVKSYKFDKKLTSARMANRTQLQARKKGGDYKYNLFSILDEAGNKGCKTGGAGCWVDNEVVAARRNRTQWNE